MTTDEIIQGIKEKGWYYTQPFRVSMRNNSWTLEIIDDNNDNDDIDSVTIEWKEGTREEIYAIYEQIKKGLGYGTS